MPRHESDDMMDEMNMPPYQMEAPANNNNSFLKGVADGFAERLNAASAVGAEWTKEIGEATKDGYKGVARGGIGIPVKVAEGAVNVAKGAGTTMKEVATAAKEVALGGVAAVQEGIGDTPTTSSTNRAARAGEALMNAGEGVKQAAKGALAASALGPIKTAVESGAAIVDANVKGIKANYKATKNGVEAFRNPDTASMETMSEQMSVEAALSQLSKMTGISKEVLLSQMKDLLTHRGTVRFREMPSRGLNKRYELKLNGNSLSYIIDIRPGEMPNITPINHDSLGMAA